MKKELESIVDLLKKNSLRVTKTRLAVSEVLLKESYLTSEEIFKKIEKKKNVNCDQVSVYRILSKFEEIGIVTKSEFNNDAARYTYNEHHKKPTRRKHEHFFKCIKCDIIEPFTDCLVGKKEKELEACGYSQLSHHLEITGLCPTCA